jgi:predicted dithiol-disulfide oxidoreductase (DUF899 family)
MRDPLTSTHPLPPLVDRETWQARLDDLLVREKALTRAGDALAAERRRLPMVEVDATTRLVAADGPVPLIDVFDGRSQLIAYFHMWHAGRPAAQQCEGCTFSTSHITELSYLNSRDVSYATFCEGPYEESSRYRDFMGWTIPWYSIPSESVEALVADRYFGILVCYAREGDRVFETYWTTGRGNEVMSPSYGAPGSHGLRPPGALGGLAGRVAAALRHARGSVPVGGSAHRPVVADRGGARRRPRRAIERGPGAPPPLMSVVCDIRTDVRSV